MAAGRTIIKKYGKHVAAIIGLLCILCITLLIYAFEIEPNWIEVTHTKIKISSGEENFTCKLLVVSDFHSASDEHQKFLEELVKEINKISEKEKIETVIILGDQIDYELKEVKFLAPLKNIKHKKVYAVLGNHDYGNGWSHKEIADEVERYMENSGINVMRNENLLACDENVRIVGVDSLWANQYDPGKAFTVNGTKEDTAGKKVPQILISHNPDIIYVLGNKQPDLIISGHTHGGQVKIPFFGALSMPSKAGEVCPEGFCEVNGHEMYITRGVGGNPRLRFLARPEISIIELE
jgi:hypothetical protein